jgi:hypothetical protein
MVPSATMSTKSRITNLTTPTEISYAILTVSIPLVLRYRIRYTMQRSIVFDKTGLYRTSQQFFSIEWKILNELTMRGSVQYIQQSQTRAITSCLQKHSFFNNDTYNKTDDGFFRKGLYTYGTGDTSNYDGSLTLAYNKIFNNKHSIYAGVNYELAETKW